MKEKGKNHRHRMDKAKYEIIIEERRERREDPGNRYIYIWLAYQQTGTNQQTNPRTWSTKMYIPFYHCWVVERFFFCFWEDFQATVVVLSVVLIMLEEKASLSVNLSVPPP